MNLRVTFISIPIQNSQRLSQKEEEGNEVEIFVPAKHPALTTIPIPSLQKSMNLSTLIS